MSTIFKFSVTGLPPTVPIKHFVWDFGDGSSSEPTTSSSTTHIYSSTGIKTIRVTVVPLNGPPRSTSIQILVTPT
jgi:PKD repeat protein